VGSEPDFLRDYRAAFLRYLPRREEAALSTGYELGRAAVVAGSSLLTIIEIHHQVLLEVLQDSMSDDLPRIATVASEFLVEALATFDMAHRGRYD